jgi:hypothetical protein
VLPADETNIAELFRTIGDFLRAAVEPVLLEPGEEPLALYPDHYSFDSTRGRLVFQAWDDKRNLVRRITSVTARKPGRLDLGIERFGKRIGAVMLLDRARPSNQSLDRRAARFVLRERFRQFLNRQFTGWKITSLSTEPDLENSLSPAYPRALVSKGGSAWAAIAAPNEAVTTDHSLTFGLIWLDYLRRRERRLLVEGLCLFLPAGKELTTCLRIRWMNQQAARFTVFLYDSGDWEEPADLNNYGNLSTKIETATSGSLKADPALPEAWLEAHIRANVHSVDAGLRREPVYGQVPAWTAGDRGILDLLACTQPGRLVILELKATAEPNLPLQALDYWLRVRWHHERGDFARHGYFPGTNLTTEPPKMILAAPALQFHPSTETILRYLAREIEVERVGLAVEWQQEIRVMFRLRGAQAPG